MKANDYEIRRALEQTAEEIKPILMSAAVQAKGLLARRIQNKGFGRHYTSRSYIALRKKKNLPIQFVNLSFTGTMYLGWNLPGATREGLKVRGFIGGSDDETKNKLRWNKSRYPEFNELNQEENDLIINEFLTPNIIEIFNKNIGL